MAAEQFWKQALVCSDAALSTAALKPLPTDLDYISGWDGVTFELRHLSGLPPRHLRSAGPKPNPFRPWDRELEVAAIGEQHVLILNKYPVQFGHMLLITQTWAPQKGWLSLADWTAVAEVDQDTTGLWFFNSGPEAGASQPHRHLQLLPRRLNTPTCPRQHWFEHHSHQPDKSPTERALVTALSRSCVMQRFENQDLDGPLLWRSYLDLCERIGLGSPNTDPQPLAPYNMLLTRQWMALVRRLRDGVNGFSVNALGFAGYLLSTERSDRHWLRQSGPEALLGEVVQPKPIQ